ncbi:TPA: DUF2130 domain-containing protein [Candidatus Berkelbacteria bacterium]|uniref:DUF2130 domain-containing protein n=1 Tax=Berkelbacteria bacterium GW2011_GWE1_39_12 TaxID=1618337 RepID=A0A0G4B1X6_9BACT|nr:MAG: hypothetical protein UT28_C0001G0015 [Berkelbacteria bacterium GW2011_GWE1_39_12]HBO60082.1 DUF2130 domain-containing protein [Candidatus Berkelbacteria bacterium]
MSDEKSDKIKCPKCGCDIPVTEVLQHRMVEQVTAEVEKRVKNEKEKIEEELKESLGKEQANNLKVLKEKLDIEAKKRVEAENKELEFIKKQTEMEENIRRKDIEIATKLQEERKLIIEKTQNEIEEKFSLQTAEMRKQLEDTKKALTEAQRKAQQGSMQTQGEVMELALEELLKQRFPHDAIEPVPKGINGADIIQRVFSDFGAECGSIVWESKQTKAWTEDWVQKLKDDGRNIKGSLLILVSEVLPKDIKNFGLYKGIWVCNFPSIIGLTTALRSQLISISKITASQSGKEEKKDILYDYLCSQNFANRISAIGENFIAMKTNLDKEKIAMNKIWSSRETQINRMMENTAKMYGEIQGIAGNQLPELEVLELESAAGEIEPARNASSIAVAGGTPATPKEPKKKEIKIDESQAGLF